MFFLIINIFQLSCWGGPNFLPKSGFLYVAQFWTLGNDCKPPFCADPKVSECDNAENTPCLCKINVLYKKLFFLFGPFPGHAPASEITISATCWRCECAPRSKINNILTNIIFIEMQKTLLAIKLMYFVTTVLFLLRPIL